MAQKQPAPAIAQAAGKLRVSAASYTFEYNRTDDSFRISDPRGQIIASGSLQPAVVIASPQSPSTHMSSPGRVAAVDVEGHSVRVVYDAVNGAARLQVSLRFEQDAFWINPILYTDGSRESIVSLQYFADPDSSRSPSLHSSYLIAPGISQGAAISPILNETVRLNQDIWLGRGSSSVGLCQQWGLPVHYFCGFSLASPGPERDIYASRRSHAFTCGLADLPNGDLFLRMRDGSFSPWVDYRGDLWNHLHGVGELSLGATLLFTFAESYYEAIALYYDELVRAGIVKVKHSSAHKAAVTLTPEYCTWGAQLARGKTGDGLDQVFLDQLYAEFKSSGMKAGLFSVDDKWEASYGALEHSAQRLPHFEQFLARVRAEGHRIGIWAAIMRCENPAAMGLTLDHMLKRPDGSPFVVEYSATTRYYIFDFTQPEVVRVLTEAVRRFMRRYRPDVFKFDFGYELPAMSVAAPHDRSSSGERLMARGLEVVLSVMREENPDLVVMYYNLSPLFAEHFDLHSTDDLFLNAGNFEVEANRRIFFASLLGRLGIPTYGSSGYDWSSSSAIWFDSAATGAIGSLNDFAGDPAGETPSPRILARYNGIARALRTTTVFQIVPVGDIPWASVRGAHARSWARFEEQRLTLFAYRPTPPGEEDLLADSNPDPRLRDVLRSAGPVLIASRDDESITASHTLAIVPYTGGQVSLLRSTGSQAVLTHYYFGGVSAEARVPIQSGRLTFTVSSEDANSRPLEWIEAQIL